MYIVVERTQENPDRGRQTGLLVAGKWDEYHPPLTPVLGVGYQIFEVGSLLSIVSTTKVTEVISTSPTEVRFKTENAEYRVFLSPSKLETLYELTDRPKAV